MKDVLDCARAEELFSDYREDALPAPLRADLENHLATCAACPDLLRALDEVLGVLRTPLDLDPSASLAARVAEASWRRARATVVAIRPPVRVPLRVHALAAGLAALATAAFLFVQQAPVRPASVAGKVKARTANVAASAQEQAVRLFEDLRMLRVMIATAFEGRVDRVNDRVDDYRRLLEKRRQHPPDSRQSRTGPPSRTADHLRTGSRTVS
jgi:putative zinc finger protein